MMNGEWVAELPRQQVGVRDDRVDVRDEEERSRRWGRSGKLLNEVRPTLFHELVIKP